MSRPGSWSAWLQRHWLPLALAVCVACALAPLGLGQFPIIINGAGPLLGAPIEHSEGPGNAEESEPEIVLRLSDTPAEAPQVIDFPGTPNEKPEAPQVLDFPVIPHHLEKPRIQPIAPAMVEFPAPRREKPGELAVPRIAEKTLLPPIIDRFDTPEVVKAPIPPLVINRTPEDKKPPVIDQRAVLVEVENPKPALVIAPPAAPVAVTQPKPALVIERPDPPREEQKPIALPDWPASPRTNASELPRVVEKPVAVKKPLPALVIDKPAAPVVVKKPLPALVIDKPAAPLVVKKPLPALVIDKPAVPVAVKEPLPALVIDNKPAAPVEVKKPTPLVIERPGPPREDEKPIALPEWSTLPSTDPMELPRVMADKPVAAPKKSIDSEFVPATTSKVGELPTDFAKETVVEPPPPMFQQARFGAVIGMGPAPEPMRIEASQVGDPQPIEAREKPRTSGLSYSIRPVRFDLPTTVTSPYEDDEITLNETKRARPPQLPEPIANQPYGNFNLPAWPGAGRGLPCNVTYRQAPPMPAPAFAPARVRVGELMVWPLRVLTEPFRDLLD